MFIEIILEKTDYIVCYDITDDYEQIRFKNYTKNKVSLELDAIVDSSQTVISEGQCGDNLTYVLYEDGRFIIEGTGSMYNYHSGKVPPWNGFENKIKSVELSNGMTTIGSQSLRNFIGISEVDLPDSIKTIGTYGLAGATSLTKIIFGKNIETCTLSSIILKNDYL